MTQWYNFFINKAPLLGDKLLQQLYLTAGAVLIAMVISIPLGIFIARRDKIKNYVLAFCSVFQTLPSLAVLGFLLPFLGIGMKTAIVTLVLYAILPIVRNTVTAILHVPADILEAADGLGFTPWQKLKIVEMPLALPVIVAGIRTATAMSVGIATLAAFIGAGGLGDFIYEGLSLNNTALILLGAVPAALLALVLDFLISRIEQMMIVKKSAFPHRARRLAYIIGGSALALISLVLLWLFFSNSMSDRTVRIGTKNFTEQLILGELMAQLIEANTSLQVIRQFNLGGTFIAHNALISGDIDIYPEYTGTAYGVILKAPVIKDTSQIYAYLQKEYQKKYQVMWLDVFGFNNTNAVAVRRKFAMLHSLTTISDLKKIAPTVTIGVPADFMERPDGFLGLKHRYQLNFGQVKLMDVGLMYKAISLNKIDAIMAFSTDGRIAAYDLVLLKDDKHLFPTYLAAPVVRSKFIKKHPEVSQILRKLAGRIDSQTMQNLNYQVDEQRRTPEEVARNFLTSRGLTP